MYEGSRNWTVFAVFSKLTPFILVAWFTWSVMLKAQAETYYLGVLAPQGEIAAQNRWQPWLDQLNAQLLDDTVVLVPLALENWQQQIDAQQFALVLGPQVQFIKMSTTRWRWLATLQTMTSSSEPTLSAENKADGFSVGFGAQESPSHHSSTVQLANQFNEIPESMEQHAPSAMEEVASALWVSADSGIYHLQDLQRRTVAGVDIDAFGGYLLVAHLLQQNGIAPNNYQMQFMGYPIERTLHALASGKADAAIAPLCLMEEMDREGKINKQQYRLLHPVETNSSCQSSTSIYPNWTLAATEQAPDALVRQVNQHVFSSEQMINPEEGLRWLPPESSMDAERVLYDMSSHPAQKPLSTHLIDWVQAHRLSVGIFVFIILISTVNYGWMSWLAWRRRRKILQQNRLIRDYDQQLRQSERFAVVGEMSGAIAHEINQPLATIQNYAQGLLIRSESSIPSEQSTAGKQHEQHHLESQNNKTTVNALRQIVHETERVAAVVSNIRRWAGRSQVNQSNEVSVDIMATYRQCVLLLGEKAANITFWLASEYQDVTLPYLLLDQLLMNCMTNAAQQGAMNIVLHVQAERHHDKEWLVLRISDDAGGFEAEQLSQNHLQNNVSSHYATRSTKAGGLGLGLMICQRLCKSIDARMQLNNIQAESVFDKVRVLKSDQKYRQYSRFKRMPSGKTQELPVHASYQGANEQGAQVSFYLPLISATRNDTQ